jgi:sulfonate transport system substrate-binding protein
MKRIVLFFQVVVALFVLAVAPVSRADQPSIIRIGVPGVGIGNRPYVGGSSAGTVHLRGQLEEEFKKDGIAVRWFFYPGAGPAVNEAFANHLIDFAFGLGDLPSVIGKAGGLKTKLLAAAGTRYNVYLAVPADSNITSIEALRGRKVAVFKGTALQLAANRILEGHGLSERDVRFINMDNATAKNALLTKDVEAAFGGYDLLQLRDQGTAKIVYVTKGDSPTYRAAVALVGTEDFIYKYPDITKRVVKNLVVAAQWISQNEGAPAPLYQLWTKSGVPFNNFKEDQDGDGANSLKVKSSPLFDEYVIGRYKAAIADAKRFNLVRSTFDVEPWIDRSFLNAVLRELSLEGYWAEFATSGAQKSPGKS